MRNKEGKRLYRLSDILAVCVVLSVITAFVFRDLFWYMGGFTFVLACIYLIIVWDDLVVWWYTRGNRKKE